MRERQKRPGSSEKGLRVGRPLPWAGTEPGENGVERVGKRPRGKHSVAFRAKVALKAIKGEKTVTRRLD
jgi:hypothetical protein